MVKRIGLCVVLAAVLAGCGGSGKGAEPVSSAVPQALAPTVVSTSDKPAGAAPASAATVAPNNTPEKPVDPEKNPPGDIPDNQAFVKYASQTGGY